MSETSETPDFNQIAREFTERAFPSTVMTVPKSEWSSRQEIVANVAEQLRHVWNAGYEVGYRDGESSHEADLELRRDP